MKGNKALIAGMAIILLLVWLVPGPGTTAQSSYDCLGVTYTVYPGTDYITNGGFEQDLNGWTTPAGGVSISTTTVHSGFQAAKLDSNPNSAYAYQYLSASPDYSVYTTWFYAKTGEWNPGEFYATELITNWDPPTGRSDATTALALYSDMIRWASWVPYGGGGMQQTIPVGISTDTWHSFQVVIDVPRAVQCLLMDGTQIGTATLLAPPSFSPSIVMFGDVSFLGNSGISYFDDLSLLRITAPLPDLVVGPSDILTKPPSPFVAGTESVVNATVRNDGNADAGGFDFWVWVDLAKDGNFGLGDLPLATVSVTSLAIGASYSVEASWTPAGPGVYTLCALADPPPGRVVELEEDNNQACVDVLVQPLPRPDYVPDGASPPSPVVIGLSLPVSLSVRVLNQGTGDATTGANLTFLNDSATPFRSFVVPPLNASESTSDFTATWLSPAVSGTYVVASDVDYDNDVIESDETNNVYAWTIEVVNGPVTSLVVGMPNYTSSMTYVRSTTPISFTVQDRSGTGIRYTRFRVDGDPWNDYTGAAFSLAGEGEHVIEWFSEDNAGNVENTTSQALRLDDTPPATSVLFGNPSYLVGGNFVTSSTPLTLQASDGGVTPVGFDHTNYSVDGGSWRVYSSPFFLATEGMHSVECRSYDFLMNEEQIRSVDVIVDNTPPATTLSIGDPKHLVGGSFVTSSTPLTLRPVDGGTIPVGAESTRYQVDGGGWKDYSSSFTLAGEGTHTVEYYSRDLLTNEETIQSIQIVVDNGPPATTLSISVPRYLVGGNFVNSSTPLTLHADDGGSPPVGTNSTFYRLWNGSWSSWREYASSFTLTGRDGTWFLEFLSFDFLGNREDVRNVTLVLDNTPPALSIDPDESVVYVGTFFTISADDGQGSGVALIEYRIDMGKWTSYSSFTLPAGRYLIEYRSSDNLDNSVERSRTVDVVAPETPPGGRVEANYKPLVAVVFAIILAVVGCWSSRKKPRKGGRDGMAVMKAFTMTSMPFVIAEAATGVVSLSFEPLRVPPVGWGMGVDCLILFVGLVFTFLRLRQARKKEAEIKGNRAPEGEEPKGTSGVSV